MTEETRIVTLTVASLGKVKENKDGTLNYQIAAAIPEISKFPTTLFVTGKIAPLPGKTYKALLSKGKQKADSDGSHDYDYFYDVVEWDVDGEPAASSNVTQFPGSGSSSPGPIPVDDPRHPVNQPLNDIDRRRAEDAFAYRRRDALNAAVAFLKDRVVPAMQSEEDVLDKATEYFTWLIEFDHPANIFSTPAKAPEPAAQPPQQAEGAEMPEGTGWGEGTEQAPETQDKARPPLSQQEFIDACKARGWSQDTVKTLRDRTGLTQTPTGGNYTYLYDALDREYEVMKS